MLDFDMNSIRKNKLELLDCQVDLILKSLEMYCYMYKFIYPRTNKSLSAEEDLRISLVTDTFEQILSEYNESKKSNNTENEKQTKINYKILKKLA